MLIQEDWTLQINDSMRSTGFLRKDQLNWIESSNDFPEDMRDSFTFSDPPAARQVDPQL